MTHKVSFGSSPKIFQIFLRLTDIAALGALLAAYEQDYNHSSFMTEINPITGTMMDSQLVNSLTNRAVISEIPIFDPVQSAENLLLGSRIG